MGVKEALILMRYEMGATQHDFAKKINRAYITVNRWENGKGFPSRSNAKTIISVAKKEQVSKECIEYLEEVLLPESRRNYSAADFGFPDIDREILFQLADGSTNALYIIEAETYKLLYTNRQADKMATQNARKKGISDEERTLDNQKNKRCYHYFASRSSPCEQCPLHSFDGEVFRDYIMSSPESGKRVKIHAKRTEINGKKAYVIYLTDLSDVDAERHALYELTNDITAGVGIYNIYFDERIELVFMNRLLYQAFDEKRRSKLRKDGKTDLCLIKPDDKERFSAELRESIKENRAFSIELNMKLSDGNYHLLKLDAKIIRRDEDKFVYYCLFRDCEKYKKEKNYETNI